MRSTLPIQQLSGRQQLYQAQQRQSTSSTLTMTGSAQRIVSKQGKSWQNVGSNSQERPRSAISDRLIERPISKQVIGANMAGNAGHVSSSQSGVASQRGSSQKKSKNGAKFSSAYKQQPTCQSQSSNSIQQPQQIFASSTFNLSAAEGKHNQLQQKQQVQQKLQASRSGSKNSWQHAQVVSNYAAGLVNIADSSSQNEEEENNGFVVEKNNSGRNSAMMAPNVISSLNSSLSNHMTTKQFQQNNIAPPKSNQNQNQSQQNQNSLSQSKNTAMNQQVYQQMGGVNNTNHTVDQRIVRAQIKAEHNVMEGHVPVNQEALNIEIGGRNSNLKYLTSTANKCENSAANSANVEDIQVGDIVLQKNGGKFERTTSLAAGGVTGTGSCSNKASLPPSGLRKESIPPQYGTMICSLENGPNNSFNQFFPAQKNEIRSENCEYEGTNDNNNLDQRSSKSSLVLGRSNSVRKQKDRDHNQVVNTNNFSPAKRTVSVQNSQQSLDPHLNLAHIFSSTNSSQCNSQNQHHLQNTTKNIQSTSSSQQRSLKHQSTEQVILEAADTELRQPMLRVGPAVYRQALDVENLISVCSKKLSEDPSHKKALFIRGSSFLKKGLLEEAIADCDALMKLSPNDASAYYIRGCTLEKMGHIDESIEAYNRVLELDPDHVNAAYARGACENKRGNYAKAIEDYMMALEKDQGRAQSPIESRRRIRQRNLNMILEDQGTSSKNTSLLLAKDNNLIGSVHSGFTSQMAPMSVNGGNGGQQSQNGSTLVGLRGSEISASSSAQINQISPVATQEVISSQNEQSQKEHLHKLHQIGMLKNKAINREKMLLSPGGGQLKALKSHQSGPQIGQLPSGEKLAQHLDELNRNVAGLKQQQSSSQNVTYLREADTESQQIAAELQQKLRLKQQNTAESEAASNLQDDLQSVKSVSNRAAPINQVPLSQELKAKAETYHAQGYAARKKSDYDQAIQLYSQALQINPRHFKALFNRGFAFDKLGKFDLAIKDYSTAIQIDPKNAFTYYNKGISLDRRGDYDQAIDCFTSAIGIEPRKADFYHNRGFAYRKQCNYEQAIFDYTKAIELDGRHFKAFYNRAFCWDKTGHLQEAEQDYLQAIGLQPNNVQAMHHLGTVAEKIGGDHLQLALDSFNKVIKMDQKYASAYNGRGLVWDRLLEFDQAIVDFTAAVNLDPQNAVYWHNRACCYRNTGKLIDSVRDYDKAINLDASNAIIYSNRGLVNRKLDRFEEAIDDYTNEIKFGTTNNVKALNNRAYCFAKLGLYKDAIGDYSSVLDTDGENIHALHNRGISYERLSQYVQAITDFTSVIKLDLENANAFFNRGCCYDSIGEIKMAIRDYSVALELDMQASAQLQKENGAEMTQSQHDKTQSKNNQDDKNNLNAVSEVGSKIGARIQGKGPSENMLGELKSEIRNGQTQQNSQIQAAIATSMGQNANQLHQQQEQIQTRPSQISNEMSN